MPKSLNVSGVKKTIVFLPIDASGDCPRSHGDFQGSILGKEINVKSPRVPTGFLPRQNRNTAGEMRRRRGMWFRTNDCGLVATNLV